MRVLRADAMGLCFGVRDALVVLDDITEPGQTTIRGELVHNAVVLDHLRERGFAMTAERTDRSNAIPATPVVVITAHGVSEVERARLAAAGKTLIDTTCPLVGRAHSAARSLADAGFHVLVIGQRDHVEVRGIVEDLASYEVVSTPDDVRTYQQERLGVICQTTVPPRRAAAILGTIRARNPHAAVRFLDTICKPTKDRQESVERLLSRVNAMVVVGGRNSNNTRELVALCRERGVPTWHVQSAEELDPSWFEGVKAVGLTAGTSTLDETIDAVEAALRSFAAPIVTAGVGAAH